MSKLNPRVISVRQLSGYIKRLFAQEDVFKNITVEGEMSEIRRHSSGHIYFTLKDAEAVLSGVMFSRYTFGQVIPKPGDKVLVTGDIVVYEPSGRYQINATAFSLSGIGDKYRQLEELKKKLEAEGFFDSANKKAIPPYCKTVGIVTAESGAAITDIRKTAALRNPYVQLILVSAQVQGEGAAESIATGIMALDMIEPDCIIVGRGGGGTDDLWAFNEEIVARAIFACKAPVISAVGHERDVTLADLVADARAATPTAAAQLAVFSIRDALNRLYENQDRLTLSAQRKVDNYQLKLDNLTNKLRVNGPEKVLLLMNNRLQRAEARLQKQNPELIVKNRKAELKVLQEKLRNSMNNISLRTMKRFELCCTRLEARSPLKRLSGGYVYSVDKENKPLNNIAQLETGDEISILLSDGKARCQVKEKTDSPFAKL